uniref:Uncharacterized protein n=1 Tax=Quercus lobata TaxID=97700 RepID=A0A7N2LMM9_QUELO
MPLRCRLPPLKTVTYCLTLPLSNSHGHGGLLLHAACIALPLDVERKDMDTRIGMCRAAKPGLLLSGYGGRDQQDYSGAYTYERIDVEGSFHTEWFKLAKQWRLGFKTEHGSGQRNSLVPKKTLVNLGCV